MPNSRSAASTACRRSRVPEGPCFSSATISRRWRHSRGAASCSRAGGSSTTDRSTTPIAQYSASLSKGKAARDWGRGHHSAIISADLLDAHGQPTDVYEPGTPFNLQVAVETTNMPGLGLEFHLRDANNLPVAFYSSSIFSQTPLPSEGRHVCRLSLQPLFLASGEYSFRYLHELAHHHRRSRRRKRYSVPGLRIQSGRHRLRLQAEPGPWRPRHAARFAIADRACIVGAGLSAEPCAARFAS
jgi:hypothetical protein